MKSGKCYEDGSANTIYKHGHTVKMKVVVVIATGVRYGAVTSYNYKNSKSFLLILCSVVVQS